MHSLNRHTQHSGMLTHSCPVASHHLKWVHSLTNAYDTSILTIAYCQYNPPLSFIKTELYMSTLNIVIHTAEKILISFSSFFKAHQTKASALLVIMLKCLISTFSPHAILEFILPLADNHTYQK